MSSVKEQATTVGLRARTDESHKKKKKSHTKTSECHTET